MFGGPRRKRHNGGGGPPPPPHQSKPGPPVRRGAPILPNALDATARKPNFRPSPQINQGLHNNNQQQQQNFHLQHQQQQLQQQQLRLRQQQQQQKNQQLERLLLQKLAQRAAQNQQLLQQQQLQQIQQQQQQQQQQLGQLDRKAVVQQPVGNSMCDEKYAQLLGDIFVGNELVPEVLDSPPANLLELTYRTVRTFPGMKVTADVTRFTPMVR